jgi:hypothetical protein
VVEAEKTETPHGKAKRAGTVFPTTGMKLTAHWHASARRGFSD